MGVGVMVGSKVLGELIEKHGFSDGVLKIKETL